jgi:hypothetical protein
LGLVSGWFEPSNIYVMPLKIAALSSAKPVIFIFKGFTDGVPVA